MNKVKKATKQTEKNTPRHVLMAEGIVPATAKATKKVAKPKTK